MDAGQRRARAYELVWRWASSSCGDKAAHGEPCENAKQAIWWSGAEGGREPCVWERQPRSICQQTVTKGAWRGLFLPGAIHRQFVRARLLKPGPKLGEQLEPWLVIDQRGPPRTLSRREWRQKRDKTRRVFNIAIIKWRHRTLATPLSWGNTEPRERSLPCWSETFSQPQQKNALETADLQIIEVYCCLMGKDSLCESRRFNLAVKKMQHFLFLLNSWKWF